MLFGFGVSIHVDFSEICMEKAFANRLYYNYLSLCIPCLTGDARLSSTHLIRHCAVLFLGYVKNTQNSNSSE